MFEKLFLRFTEGKLGKFSADYQSMWPRWLGDITANQTRPKFSFTYEDVRPKHIEVDDDGVRAVNIGPWMSLLFLKNGNFYGIEIKSANAMDKKRLYHAN